MPCPAACGLSALMFAADVGSQRLLLQSLTGRDWEALCAGMGWVAAHLVGLQSGRVGGGGCWL